MKASLGSIFSTDKSTKSKAVSLLHNLRKAGVRRRSDEGRKDECSGQNIVKRRRMSSGTTTSSTSVSTSDSASVPDTSASSKHFQGEGAQGSSGLQNVSLSDGVDELNSSKHSLGLLSNYSSSGDSS